MINELNLRQRGFECYVADPNLWVPFEDGTSFGQWLDDAKTQANLEQLKVSKQDIDGYWAYEHIFDEIRRRLRTRGRDTWVGESPTREEIEDLLHGEQTMLDIVFHASISDVLDDHMQDQRLKDALFGQGVIAAYGGPKDPGTASIKLMHYQGDLEGQGPVWGYVKGGMGMISFAIADAAREAGAQLATGVPVAEIIPGEGVRLEDGTLIEAATVLCNADPKRALDMLTDVPADYAQRITDWKVRSPVVKFNAALDRAPAMDGRTRRDLARPRNDRRHDRPRQRAKGLRGVRPRRTRGRLRRDLHPDRLRPERPRPQDRHLLSVFGQYAPYAMDWTTRRDEVAKQFIDLIERFAPGFNAIIESYEVLGPPDIEERIGLTQGNIFQGEVTPDQMWEHRLTPRTPIPGFYFCGAATHPGGSVIALNGRNAAMAVLAAAPRPSESPKRHRIDAPPWSWGKRPASSYADGSSWSSKDGGSKTRCADARAACSSLPGAAPRPSGPP